MMDGDPRRANDEKGLPDSDSTDPVASAVRQRRLALDLTQAQLGYLAGVSEGSIGNLENGSVVPRARTWSTIQAALGWAPGSLERLKAGRQAIEILPFSLLEPIITDLIFGQNDSVDMEVAARDFRYLVSRADEKGQFSRTYAKEFVHFVAKLGEDLLAEPEYEQIDEDDFRLVHDGGWKQHQELVERVGNSITVEAPPIVTSAPPGLGPGTGKPTWESIMTGGPTYKLPKEIEEALSGTETIDHAVLSDESSDSTAAIYLLVKRNDRAFTTHDIEHILRFQDVKTRAESATPGTCVQQGPPEHFDITKPTPADPMTSQAEPEDGEGSEAEDYFVQQEIDRRRGK